MQYDCENCLHYTYDDVADCYDCEMNLDEDELYRLYEGGAKMCPFYRFGDEYLIVKKQM
jgi:hypothetical protein